MRCRFVRLYAIIDALFHSSTSPATPSSASTPESDKVGSSAETPRLDEVDEPGVATPQPGEESPRGPKNKRTRGQPVKSSKVRPDGRCGPQNPLSSGAPGECDPLASAPRRGPCCSPFGYCGSSPAHCSRPGSIDFRRHDEPKPNPRDDSNSGPTFAEAMDHLHAQCRWVEASSSSEDEGDLFDHMDPESSDALRQVATNDDDLDAPLAAGQQVLPPLACEFVLSGGCCEGCPAGQCFCDGGKCRENSIDPSSLISSEFRCRREVRAVPQPRVRALPRILHSLSAPTSPETPYASEAFRPI